MRFFLATCAALLLCAAPAAAAPAWLPPENARGRVASVRRQRPVAVAPDGTAVAAWIAGAPDGTTSPPVLAAAARLAPSGRRRRYRGPPGAGDVARDRRTTGPRPRVDRRASPSHGDAPARRRAAPPETISTRRERPAIAGSARTPPAVAVVACRAGDGRSRPSCAATALRPAAASPRPETHLATSPHPRRDRGRPGDRGATTALPSPGRATTAQRPLVEVEQPRAGGSFSDQRPVALRA